MFVNVNNVKWELTFNSYEAVRLVRILIRPNSKLAVAVMLKLKKHCVFYRNEDQNVTLDFGCDGCTNQRKP